MRFVIFIFGLNKNGGRNRHGKNKNRQIKETPKQKK